MLSWPRLMRRGPRCWTSFTGPRIAQVEQVHVAGDGVEGGAKLVAHRREEVALGAVRALGRHAGTGLAPRQPEEQAAGEEPREEDRREEEGGGAGLEGGLRGVAHRPGVAGDLEDAHRRALRLVVAGPGARRSVQQRRGVRRGAVVDADAHPRRVLRAEEAREEVVRAEGAVDEALQPLAPRLDRGRDAAAAVDGDVEEKPRLLLPVDLLDERHLPGERRTAAVAGGAHRRATRRLGVHVEPERRLVPRVHRLQEADGMPLVRLAGEAAGHALAPTDPLDARIAGLQIEAFDVAVELLPRHAVPGGEERGAAPERRQVDLQTAGDAVLRVLDRVLEAGLVALVRAPAHEGRRRGGEEQRRGQNQPGSQRGDANRGSSDGQ